MLYLPAKTNKLECNPRRLATVIVGLNNETNVPLVMRSWIMIWMDSKSVDYWLQEGWGFECFVPVLS